MHLCVPVCVHVCVCVCVCVSVCAHAHITSANYMVLDSQLLYIPWLLVILCISSNEEKLWPDVKIFLWENKIILVLKHKMITKVIVVKSLETVLGHKPVAVVTWMHSQ